MALREHSHTHGRSGLIWRDCTRTRWASVTPDTEISIIPSESRDAISGEWSSGRVLNTRVPEVVQKRKSESRIAYRLFHTVVHANNKILTEVMRSSDVP